MSQTYKFGNGKWATKKGSTLAYNDENNNFKPLPFTTTRDSIATRVNKEGLIEVVSNDVPRIDYTDSADGALLLEPQRTNLITYSEDLTQSWWFTNTADVVLSTNLSPDGTQNAYKVTYGTSGNRLGGANFSLPNTPHTNSIYMRKISGSGVVDFKDQLGGSNTVNLTEDWQRYTITTTLTDGTARLYIDLQTLNDVIEVYGAQQEEGDYASSYIPTNGSTVTRLADTASGSGNSEVFNDSEGVLFADISSENDNSTKIISLASTSGSENTVWIGYADGVYGIVRSGGVTVVETNIFPTQNNEITKCAILYSNSNVKFYINGFNLFEDTNVSMPIGLDQLRFSRKGGSLPFYGKTKELGYYDTALTDEELETLTSYRSLNELVTELNLNTL